MKHILLLAAALAAIGATAQQTYRPQEHSIAAYGLTQAVLYKAAGVVTPEQFGAKGDNVANDGPALEKAINATGATHIMALKKYKTDRYLYLKSGQTFEGDTTAGSITPLSTLTQKQQGLISARGANVWSIAKTVQITRGKKTITYTPSSSAYAVKVGMILKAVGGKKPGVYDGSDTYNYGEYRLVTGVSGTTVTLDDTAYFTFTATTLTLINPIKDVTFKNVRMNMSGRTTGYAVQFSSAVNGRITGCSVTGSLAVVNGNTQGIKVSGINNYIGHNYLRNYNNGTATGTSYAGSFDGSNITVEYNKFHNNASGATSGGREYDSHHVNYQFNEATGNGYAHQFDYHANTSGRIHHNYIKTSLPWTFATVRASNTRIDHNLIEWDNTAAKEGAQIYIFEQAEDNVLVDSNIMIVKGGGSGNRGVQISGGITPRVLSIKIFGNRFTGAGITSGADFHATKGHLEIYNNDFFATATNPNPRIYMTGELYRYTIRDNRFTNQASASTFNYHILTSPFIPAAAPFTTGLIENNRFTYKFDQSNASIRIQNHGNVVKNNKWVVKTAAFYTDVSTAKINNTYSGNGVLLAAPAPKEKEKEKEQEKAPAQVERAPIDDKYWRRWERRKARERS